MHDIDSIREAMRPNRPCGTKKRDALRRADVVMAMRTLGLRQSYTNHSTRSATTGRYRRVKKRVGVMCDDVRRRVFVIGTNLEGYEPAYRMFNTNTNNTTRNNSPPPMATANNTTRNIMNRAVEAINNSTTRTPTRPRRLKSRYPTNWQKYVAAPRRSSRLGRK